MSPIVSYWMPVESSNVIIPSIYARQVVGVVKGLFRQTLDRDTYWSLLAERLNELLLKEEDPEVAYVQLLEDLDKLLDISIPDVVEEKDNFRRESQAVMSELSLYLDQLEIPGKLPERMPPNTLTAQKIYEETTLDIWVSNLTNRPTNPDR